MVPAERARRRARRRTRTLCDVWHDGVWHGALPASFEAFFFPINAPVHHREGDEATARRLHAAFRREFHLAAQGSNLDVPLLSFDVGEARRGRAPFRQVA